MRWRSWVIITPPSVMTQFIPLRHLTVFLPHSGFVQQVLTLVDARRYAPATSSRLRNNKTTNLQILTVPLALQWDAKGTVFCIQPKCAPEPYASFASSLFWPSVSLSRGRSLVG